MHALICGFGSIGRRHLRHLRALGVTRIDAYRTGLATFPDDSHSKPDRTFSDLDEALRQGPDVVLVTNPTAFHVETARRAVEAGCHVLIEKPVSDSLAGLADLDALASARGLVVSVAQNLRYHPTLLALRRLIQDQGMGQAVMFRAHFGAFLPAWHPWEDYRNSYAARRALGGGCRRTHIHEVDFAIWLMGSAERAVSLDSGCSPLGTDVDEATAILIRHRSGALSIVSLSLAQAPTSRTVDVAFTEGTFSVDLRSGDWSSRPRDGEEIRGCPPPGFDMDQTYREQDAAFLRAVQTDQSAPVPLGEAIEVLRIALSGEED